MTKHWLHAPYGDTSSIAMHALQLLGAPATEQFNRIVRLATRALDVPIVAIILTRGNEAAHLAHIGLSTPPSSAPNPWIEHLERHDPLQPQTVDDTRVAPPPCPHVPSDVESYATQLLRVDGTAVGLLLVADTSARTFSEEDLANIVDLAHWASAELRAEGERRLLDELEVLSERTETILASLAEGIAGIGADGTIAFVNPAGCMMLGWPEDELLGRSFHDTVMYRRTDGSAYPSENSPVSEVLRTRNPRRHLTSTFIRRDGSVVPVDWSVGPVESRLGDRGVAIVFADATRRLELEEIKSRFMSVVSHEMRTPLTSLLGALRLIDGGAAGSVSGEAAHLLAIAVRNGARLAQLIDDVLDAERAESGSLQLRRARIEVDSLMGEAADTVAGIALEAGVGIQVEGCGASVWGDAHRLLQVLTNLLGNAIRFSAAGGVVRLLATPQPEHVRISVSDSGIGIDEQSVQRVFDPFWQVDASDARSHAGSGLGLAIARSIVALHGGELDVESTPGVGTTFTVNLPLRSRAVATPIDLRKREDQS